MSFGIEHTLVAPTVRRIADVRPYIDRANQSYEQHLFFRSLAVRASLESSMRFAPAMTFWVMTFQDVVRINARLATDRSIRELLEHHVTEDLGHERWFLEDLQAIAGHGVRDVPWLFGRENQAIRELSFALVSDVHHIESDVVRLVFVLALERAGRACFERLAPIAAAFEPQQRLKYFSRFHLETEKAHELATDDVAAVIDALVIDDDAWAGALAIVDLVYARICAMANVLVAHGAEPPASRVGSVQGAVE